MDYAKLSSLICRLLVAWDVFGNSNERLRGETSIEFHSQSRQTRESQFACSSLRTWCLSVHMRWHLHKAPSTLYTYTTMCMCMILT